MKNTYLYLIIFLCFLLPSCSNDNAVNSTGPSGYVDSTQFVYPTAVGSSWGYTRIFSAENIQPDSVRHYFSHLPVYGSGTVSILYDTTVNSDSCKCFYERYIEDSTLFDYRVYLGNTAGGLMVYGYRFGQGFFNPFSPFSKQANIRFKCGSYSSSSIEALMKMVEYGAGSSALDVSSDTMITFTPPLLSMKYPIVSGTEWLFLINSMPDTIYKKYIDFENIIFGGRSITCVKTQRRWAESFSDAQMFEYDSKFGKLKEDFLVHMIVTNEFGTPIGTADMRDLKTVSSYVIH